MDRLFRPKRNAFGRTFVNKNSITGNGMQDL